MNKQNVKRLSNSLGNYTHTCSENVFFGVDAGSFAEDKR